MPMYWNNYKTARFCELDEVLPPLYTVGVITPTFALIWLVMLMVYWRIWREAAGHTRRLRATDNSGTPSDWKSVQVVLLILGGFTICWLPYFCVACAQAYDFLDDDSPTLYKGAFSLAMANSGMNPIIYAWKNSSFRVAFGRLIRCRNPDSPDQRYISDQLPRKHNAAVAIRVGDVLNNATPVDANRNGVKEAVDLEKSVGGANQIELNNISGNVTEVDKDTKMIICDLRGGDGRCAHSNEELQLNVHVIENLGFENDCVAKSKSLTFPK